MTNYVRVGDFANRAGVSIRTLRYYDRIGLLKPSAYSESGQRLYTELDYARLQQILTLKLIGLSLDEIKSLLTTESAGIADLLERQKHALRHKASQLLMIAHTIEKAQIALQAAPKLDLEAFVSIIRMVNMHTQSDWFAQFVDSEGQEKIAAHNQTLTLADHKQVGLDWQTLFKDIQEHKDKDIHNPSVQQLVARWDNLMMQFASADPDLATRLNQAYADIDHAADPDHTPPELQEWMNELRDAALFIQKARAVQRG